MKKNEKVEVYRVEYAPPPPLFPIVTWLQMLRKPSLHNIYQHYPKDKKLSKFFNRNTIKVSYSCIPKVKQTISSNNNRLLQLRRTKNSIQDSTDVTVGKNNSCPGDGKCLTKCVVYKATVTEQLRTTKKRISD